MANKTNKAVKTASRRARSAGTNASRAIDQANAAVNYVKSLPTSGIGPWYGPKNTVPVGQAASSLATCPAGTRVISGGGSAVTSEGIVASQATSDRTGWFVVTGELVTPGTVEAVAYCARTGNYTTARAHASARREIEALEGQYQSRMRADR